MDHSRIGLTTMRVAYGSFMSRRQRPDLKNGGSDVRMRMADMTMLERHGEQSFGALDVYHDAGRDLICVNCRGRWSPSQVDACFAQTNALDSDMRSRLGHVRVLVDRRDPTSQAPITVDRLRMQAERGYRPGDRVAVLVGSSLLKSQLRQQLDPTTHKLFISETAAAMWLTANG